MIKLLKKNEEPTEIKWYVWGLFFFLKVQNVVV